MAESEAEGGCGGAVRTECVEDIVAVANNSLSISVCFWLGKALWSCNGMLGKEGKKEIQCELWEIHGEFFSFEILYTNK